MYKLTDKFNKEVIGIDRKMGTIEDKTEFHWCLGVVLEELDEFKQAHDEGDFIKELDAVTDLLYFVSGFMTRMGVPPKLAKQIFEAVHDCNMKKSKGKKVRDIQHESDAIKPKGWIPPEMKIVELLNTYESNR